LKFLSLEPIENLYFRLRSFNTNVGKF